VRQIVGEHVRRSGPVDEDIHAALQIERLGFAVKVAGGALANGDIRAIAPYIKAIGRLDHYQAIAARPRRGLKTEIAPGEVAACLGRRQIDGRFRFREPRRCN
jgi:hypothetical protein